MGDTGGTWGTRGWALPQDSLPALPSGPRSSRTIPGAVERPSEPATDGPGPAPPGGAGPRAGHAPSIQTRPRPVAMAPAVAGAEATPPAQGPGPAPHHGTAAAGAECGESAAGSGGERWEFGLGEHRGYREIVGTRNNGH